MSFERSRPRRRARPAAGRRRLVYLPSRPGTRPAGDRSRSPPRLAAGPSPLDVLGRFARHAPAPARGRRSSSRAACSRCSRSTRPASARFIQETPDRIRITQEMPAGALDRPARRPGAPGRDGHAGACCCGLRRADTVDDARGGRAAHAADARRRLDASLRQARRRRDGRVPRLARRRDVGRAGRRSLLPGLPGRRASDRRRARTIDPALRVAFFGLLYDQDIDHADPPRRAGSRGQHGRRPSSTTRRFAASVRPAPRAGRRRVPRAGGAGHPRRRTPDLKLPAGTPDERLEAFLTINGDLRRANEQQIVDTGARTRRPRCSGAGRSCAWAAPSRRRCSPTIAPTCTTAARSTSRCTSASTSRRRAARPSRRRTPGT